MKPIVYYKRSTLFPVPPVVGHSVYCEPIDHPSPNVSNTKLIRTSRVVSVEKGTLDVFETENTKYVPIQE